MGRGWRGMWRMKMFEEMRELFAQDEGRVS